MCAMADELDEVVEGEAEDFPELAARRGVHDNPEDLPAVVDVRPLERNPAPVVQAAALAATGFVAGAAAAAIVRRRATRRLGRRRRGGGLRRSPDGLPVISTHTYLVSVQVLGRPAD